ncbi:MAG: UDP-N-acetylglucosamine 1-carboxyvinyltransferase [Chloroflexi bacterium]|nr:UDP-N-acetylglucosamine 1-carboxyvinyltransferase [Chloroflexota bacterium]
MSVSPSTQVLLREVPGSRLVVEGGHPLSGSVHIGGAKNAALPIMAACMLTPEWCVLSNVPDIEDIHTMAEVLRALGVEVNFLGRHEVAIRAAHLSRTRSVAELATRMRASFLVMGPLLGRIGRVEAPHPGGCAIGVRPVNVDVRGFEAMGARISYGDGYYAAEAERLRGAKLYLDYPSHTGTENQLMAACLAQGKTVIKHASIEPEVADLAAFLTRMGARISGVGSPVIEVEGVDQLYGANFKIMPDRLAAGTFLIAGVISGGEVTTREVIPEHLDAISYKLAEAGAEVEEGRDWVRARANGRLQAVDIQAIAYPGFPTDLQAAFGALLTQASGTSQIHERVFENRLLYANELRKMGADIEVINGSMARVHGPTPLKGTTIQALDIRSGAALVLAALAAEGTTNIERPYHLDRGYEDMVTTLASLGAHLERR